MTLFARWSIFGKAEKLVQVAFAPLDTGTQLPRALLQVTSSIAFQAVADAPQFVAQRREFLS
jgi:hypothetical protein